MTKKMKDNIVKMVSQKFRTFGGGQTSEFNPIVNLTKNQEPSFAAGVDVRQVVDFVIKCIKTVKP